MSTSEREADLDARLRILLDKQEITEVLYRYATALDQRRWELLEQVFAPDAVADYGRVLGVREGVAAIAAAIRGVLEPLDSTQHSISNPSIEVSGGAAHSFCYLHSQHTRRGCEGGDNYTVGGQYRDELVRTNAGWRIRRRALEVSWLSGNPRVVAPR